MDYERSAIASTVRNCAYALYLLFSSTTYVNIPIFFFSFYAEKTREPSTKTLRSALSAYFWMYDVLVAELIAAVCLVSRTRKWKLKNIYFAN